MAVVAFDTLKLAERLQAGGFTSEQARTAAGAFAEAMSGSDLATRADLAQESAAHRADLAQESAALRADLARESAALRAELTQVRMELRADLVEVEHHLDAKIAGVKADVARLEERIERRTAESDARIQVVRSDLIKWVLGTGVAAIFTVIGAAWTIIRYLPPHT